MTAELSPAAQTLLKAFADIEARHQVATVQAAAIEARLSFMDAYTMVNELFTAGLLNQNLTVTEAGRKAAG